MVLTQYQLKYPEKLEMLKTCIIDHACQIKKIQSTYLILFNSHDKCFHHVGRKRG